MKLYTYDPAPNPQRLALFMKYKGIEIETQQIDMMAGEQLGDEYRAIVPERTVPALVLDDGTVLTEVIGICTYLEALYPEKPLLGTTPLEKAPGDQLGLTKCSPCCSWRSPRLCATAVLASRAAPCPATLDLEQIPALVERGKASWLIWGCPSSTERWLTAAMAGGG